MGRGHPGSRSNTDFQLPEPEVVSEGGGGNYQHFPPRFLDHERQLAHPSDLPRYEPTGLLKLISVLNKQLCTYTGAQLQLKERLQGV